MQQFFQSHLFFLPISTPLLTIQCPEFHVTTSAPRESARDLWTWLCIQFRGFKHLLRTVAEPSLRICDLKSGLCYLWISAFRSSLLRDKLTEQVSDNLIWSSNLFKGQRTERDNVLWKCFFANCKVLLNTKAYFYYENFFCYLLITHLGFRLHCVCIYV